MTKQESDTPAAPDNARKAKSFAFVYFHQQQTRSSRYLIKLLVMAAAASP